ncbi:MAG TPA: metal ABC transporter permease [Gammaproteobacteria bacterium]|nr:metal ABC transporter permease [Gammaproteobacteria bacterium]
MNFDLVFDPLFHVPFLVGLIMSALLPLLGNLLRLRDEWLAALGLAYLASATGLIGLAANIPTVLGAPLGALAGAAIKALSRFHGNTVYATMVLVGWCTTMLVAANSPLGDVIGHALIEGQLYFAGTIHLAAAATVGLIAAVALPRLIPPLVRACLVPRHEVANRLPAWRWHLGFDALAALGMAIGAGTLGLMGAFALAFVPPLAAFRIARSWRHCQWISAGVGVVAYTAAFVIALAFDQPFGPVLVAVLVLTTAAAALARRA